MKWTHLFFVHLLPKASRSGRIKSCFVLDFQKFADDRKRREKQHSRRMRTVELLDLSDEFDRLLRTGEVNRRAELAAIYGISRARVTQLLNLQKLHPDIRAFVREHARASWGNFISERSLRPLVKMTEERQLEVAVGLWPRFVERGAKKRMSLRKARDEEAANPPPDRHAL